MCKIKCDHCRYCGRCYNSWCETLFWKRFKNQNVDKNSTIKEKENVVEIADVVKNETTEVKEVAKVIDGKIEKRWVCDFGITLDERIADGVYYAKAVNLLEYILDNPKMLEGDCNDKINME